MKESKIVSTIINNVGDNNRYKDTSDYLFEIILPSRKETISFAEEYYTLEDRCVESLKDDYEYCELISKELDVFSDLIINNNIDKAISKFISIFENIKDNYCIRLENVSVKKLVNPDLYHN